VEDAWRRLRSKGCSLGAMTEGDALGERERRAGGTDGAGLGEMGAADGDALGEAGAGSRPSCWRRARARSWDQVSDVHR